MIVSTELAGEDRRKFDGVIEKILDNQNLLITQVGANLNKLADQLSEFRVSQASMHGELSRLVEQHSADIKTLQERTNSHSKRINVALGVVMALVPTVTLLGGFVAWMLSRYWSIIEDVYRGGVGR